MSVPGSSDTREGKDFGGNASVPGNADADSVQETLNTAPKRRRGWADDDGTPSGTCENCGKRPGTKRWVGEGGALAISHGFYEMWCERCVLEAQIAHAEKLAERLPALRAALADMVAAGTPEAEPTPKDSDVSPRAVVLEGAAGNAQADAGGVASDPCGTEQETQR